MSTKKEEYAKNLVKLFNSSTQFAGAQRRGEDKWRSCQRHDAQVLHWKPTDHLSQHTTHFVPSQKVEWAHDVVIASVRN
jgi:hypothetical protein